MYHCLLQYYFGFAQKFYIHTIKVLSRNDIPYPSYADSLWLLGYVFMAHHLYSSFYYWNKKNKFSESSVFIITIFSALLILFLVQSSVITYSNDIYSILVAISISHIRWDNINTSTYFVLEFTL